MKKKTQPKSSGGPVSGFIQHHFRHFNAATLVDAARAYRAHLDAGGRMMICLAGAMSTAELGLSLAEMIRRDKVHLITCTGANLEEDVFNLVAHDYYERVPHYRHLTPRLMRPMRFRKRSIPRRTPSLPRSQRWPQRTAKRGPF